MQLLDDRGKGSQFCELVEMGELVLEGVEKNVLRNQRRGISVESRKTARAHG